MGGTGYTLNGRLAPRADRALRLARVDVAAGAARRALMRRREGVLEEESAAVLPHARVAQASVRARPAEPAAFGGALRREECVGPGTFRLLILPAARAIKSRVSGYGGALRREDGVGPLALGAALVVELALVCAPAALPSVPRGASVHRLGRRLDPELPALLVRHVGHGLPV